jgi:heterodisulfide reductase subunit A-like polyferredoxin
MKVVANICKMCLACVDVCPVGAIKVQKNGAPPEIDQKICLECGCCTASCPNDAIVSE